MKYAFYKFGFNKQTRALLPFEQMNNRQLIVVDINW